MKGGELSSSLLCATWAVLRKLFNVEPLHFCFQEDSVTFKNDYYGTR